MNAQKNLITVTRYVPILWVHLHAHVTMDSHWTIMAGRAVVCMSIQTKSIFHDLWLYFYKT